MAQLGRFAGTAVVAWLALASASGAQKFPVGVELQVNTYTEGDQEGPVVAAGTAGGFIVAWNSEHQDGDSFGVFAQRFSSGGDPLGAELQVNTYTTSVQRYPSLAVADDGDFVVTWQSYGQDGSYHGVFARRFASDGTPQAAEIQVNAYTENDQRRSTVAITPDGSFLVAWQSFVQDGADWGVFGQRFTSSGTPLGAELQLNTYTSDSQNLPTVAAGADGDFVVAWTSYFGQDGDLDGIFARRFTALTLFDIDGNGAVAALTDGLLVLRYLFGFTGSTLVTGAVDLMGCTRCDASAIEAYLASLS